jgi:hypothetical protein
MNKRWIPAMWGAALLGAAAATHAGRAENHSLSVKNLSVWFSSEEGRIVSATLGPNALIRPLGAYTHLTGCEQVGPAEFRASRRSVEWVRTFAQTGTTNACTVTERFSRGREGIRWEVEIAGAGAPWSTAIETHLVWPADVFPAKTWMAESGPTGPMPPLHFLTDRRAGRILEWHDPLVLQPFTSRQLPYGGACDRPGFCLPLVTVVDAREDLGLTLALSPEDVPCTMGFRSEPDGCLVFARSNLRISEDSPVRLAMDLVAHEGDWRAALGWMVERYPDFFNPPNPNAALIAGCGAFCSSYAGDLDVAKMKAMGAGVNWGYGFTFPYIGMYLPYVKEGGEWVSFEGRRESTHTLEHLARKWRSAGIRTLAEFVTTEWGYKALDGKRIPSDDMKADKAARINNLYI